MKHPSFKALIPWVAAIVIFMVISLVYFSPVLEGKRLSQDDIIRHKGVSKEIADFREKSGKEPLWTNAMFGGMPSFQTSTLYPGNLTRFADKILTLSLPHPANLVFLYALGFFILLMVLRINPWLAVAGSLGFAFSSYFFIILEAGHNSKAHAIGYMAPVIAAVILTYRGKYLAGGILTCLFLALQISANHLQITYYLMMIILLLATGILVQSIRDKTIPSFLKASGILVIAAIISIGPNVSNLWTTYEYSQYSIRGKSELTSNQENKTSGLDKDYATAWSYGISESLTLLIPNFKGGSSNSELSKNSEMYRVLQDNNVPNADQIIKGLPTYWGPQPFTSGPVYIGAVLVFLFILGLILVKGTMKWVLLAATLLSLFLSWGHHFAALTDFFLHNIPMYNKFRAVSMTLVIAELTIPLLGILVLDGLIRGETDTRKAWQALKIAFIVSGGLSLFFALFPGWFFDFTSAEDAQLKTSGYPDWFINTLVIDRQHMLRNDAFRSFAFILLAGILLWGLIRSKLRPTYVILGIGLLVLVDLWAVNRRYINNDNFVRKSQMQYPYSPSQADEFILKDKDPNFRVLNVTVNTFNDASTSYYHKSIGGYHGAKLRRYQELIENQISKNNQAVLNMLNTKYFILKGGDGQPVAQPNMQALGNAWFVKATQLVANADSEMVALGNFDPARTAIIDKRFENHLKAFSGDFDSTAVINLKSYQPNHLVYESDASVTGLAVFSEIYYEKGWEATIDGKPAPHFRCNYVLRAMVIPAGKHTIEFRFHPKSYFTGEKISLASSLLLVLLVAGLLAGSLYRQFFRKDATS